MALPAISHKTAKSICNIAGRSVLSIGINEGFLNILASFCKYSKNDDDKNYAYSVKLPPEPQNCCMSGCAKCVWVTYAEQVAKILGDGGEAAKKKIIEEVKDPNLRAFLMLELGSLFKKKK